MAKHSKKSSFGKGLFFFVVLMLTPLWVLFLSTPSQTMAVDESLFNEAIINTTFLAGGVLFLSTIIGIGLAFLTSFYRFFGGRFFHLLIMLPLALPSYVTAFIYLGVLGPSASLSEQWGIEIQGELWFLVLLLSLSLTPYIYFFTSIGLSHLRQSEWESEKIMNGGKWCFFRWNILPHILLFVVSGQVLVTFEALADFGAASIINVPVMTTMIYKVWYDLFSFEGAVFISLRYSMVILLLLIPEYYLKHRSLAQSSHNLDPLKKTELPNIAKFLGLPLLLVYLILALFYPVYQLIMWVSNEAVGETIESTLSAATTTLLIGLSVGLLVVVFSLGLGLVLRILKRRSQLWMVTSTIGYSVPGAILAVSAYSILLLITDNVGVAALISALIIALAYKFLTVGLRPVGESINQLPKELDELSLILGVSWWRRLHFYYWPYLKESLIVSLLLVFIEVMKEMPLTLMLSPSQYQTLSIQIFNLTSEGEWGKAALPSLTMVIVGMISVLLLNFRRTFH